MFSLNVQSDRLFLGDLKKTEMETVFKWYNISSKYSFATGSDKPISMNEMWQNYKIYLESPNIFYCYIQKIHSSEPIGMLKGYIMTENTNAFWINILMILEQHQRNGYGKEVIELLFNTMKRENRFKNVYLSCSNKNKSGLSFWGKMGFEHVETVPNKEINKKDIIVLGKKI